MKIIFELVNIIWNGIEGWRSEITNKVIIFITTTIKKHLV